MIFTDEQRRRAFDRTCGECHLCWGKLAWSNYGVHGRRGAWEIEHSVAQARGGTHHGNNLYAAHVACNRRKRDAHNRTARAYHGRTRAPWSEKKRENARWENAAATAGIGGLFAALLGAPVLPFALALGVLGHARRVR